MSYRVTTTVVTPPSAIVSLAEAKAFLRVDSDDENALITQLVAAAFAWLDGPAGHLGWSFGQQVLEAHLSDFPVDPLQLPFGPVISPIISVKYLDDLGAEQTLATSAYSLLSDGRVQLNYNQRWPAVYAHEEAVSIRYTAGYATPPEPIRTAILMTVAEVFESREALLDEVLSSGVIASLYSPYRILKVG